MEAWEVMAWHTISLNRRNSTNHQQTRLTEDPLVVMDCYPMLFLQMMILKINGRIICA